MLILCIFLSTTYSQTAAPAAKLTSERNSKNSSWDDVSKAEVGELESEQQKKIEAARQEQERIISIHVAKIQTGKKLMAKLRKISTAEENEIDEMLPIARQNFQTLQAMRNVQTESLPSKKTKEELFEILVNSEVLFAAMIREAQQLGINIQNLMMSTQSSPTQSSPKPKSLSLESIDEMVDEMAVYLPISNNQDQE
jgi:hypothetical protein